MAATRAAALLLCLASAVALAPRNNRPWRSAWRRRGVTSNPDMPPLAVVAQRVGARPPWTAPKWVWTACWRAHARALPSLHRWDAAAPANTCVNLQVLWLKALAGDGAAYELLPRGTRRLVARPLRFLFPRLHHQNVLLRSRFLDAAVTREVGDRADDVAVIALGAGFDTRAARLFSGSPARTAEVDLPAVVAQKRALATRLETFAPADASYACDLADARAARAAIDAAAAGRARVVFVVEALLVYLDADAARALLAACAATRAADVSLCFADALPGVAGVAEADAAAALRAAGFDLVAYLPKPGLARHMGVARRRR